MPQQSPPTNEHSPFFSGAQIRFLFFSYDGKINREKYLSGILCLFGYLFIFSIIPAVPLIPIFTTLIAFAIWIFVCFTATLGLFAVIIKRLHDVGGTGWLSLLLFLPILNILLLLYLAIVPGKDSQP